MKEIMRAIFFAGACALCGSASAAEKSGGIAADSELVCEKLPNGVVVAVYPNKEPPNRVSMRLVVGRGSSTETQAQRGLAHFTEHMAFKGTDNFPSGEMIEYFQRIGMAFGADTNAYTSFDETVYKIDMPDVSDKSISDGLKLLADYAGGVLFHEDAIEPERGVIIAEKRARDTAPYRAFVSQWRQIWGKDSPYSTRLPIGEDEVIKSAPRDEFIRFYKSNYRPENMTVVVVGDVSAADILKSAAEAFGRLKPDAAYEAAKLPDINIPDDENFEPSLENLAGRVNVEIFTDPELKGSSADIYMLSKDIPPKNTEEELLGKAKLSAIEYMLGRRFEKLALQEGARITRGDASFEPVNDMISASFISVSAPAGDSKWALQAAALELSRALRYGFTEAELKEAKAELLNRAKLEVKAKPTRKTQELADLIASSYARGRTVISPETTLDIATKAYGNFTAQDASDLFRSRFSKGRFFAFVAATKAPKYNAEKFLEELSKVQLSAPEDKSGAEFAYSKCAGKAVVVKSETDGELGIERAVYENGVRANVKRTDFSSDSVLVRIDVGAGKLDFSQEDCPLALLADLCFEAGGLKAHTRDELESIFAGKTVSFGFSVDEASFAFSGRTNAENLKDQLLLLRAYITDFALRKECLSVANKKAEEMYRLANTTPEGAIRSKVMRSLLSGNARFGYQVGKTYSPEDLKRLGDILRKAFDNGWFEVSVVGDVDVKMCMDTIAQVFGSLPKRSASRLDLESKLDVKFAEGEINIGIESALPRAAAMLAWRSSPMKDIKAARAESLLGEILDDAIRKGVREKTGAVYSPFAYNNPNKIYPFGVLIAGSIVESDKSAEVLSMLEQISKNLPGAITQDMFDRAKTPLLKQIEKMRRDNLYWLMNVLSLSQAYPERLDWARTIVSGFDGVSLEDVRKRAADVLSAQPTRISVSASN